MLPAAEPLADCMDRMESKGECVLCIYGPFVSISFIYFVFVNPYQRL